MPATGARRGHLVYHWRHGWIPLDHFAALSKAHHSKSGAVKVMQKHGIDVPKAYRDDHTPGVKAPSGDHVRMSGKELHERAAKGDHAATAELARRAARKNAAGGKIGGKKTGVPFRPAGEKPKAPAPATKPEAPKAPPQPPAPRVEPKVEPPKASERPLSPQGQYLRDRGSMTLAERSAKARELFGVGSSEHENALSAENASISEALAKWPSAGPNHTIRTTVLNSGRVLHRHEVPDTGRMGLLSGGKRTIGKVYEQPGQPGQFGAHHTAYKVNRKSITTNDTPLGAFGSREQAHKAVADAEAQHHAAELTKQVKKNQTMERKAQRVSGVEGPHGPWEPVDAAPAHAEVGKGRIGPAVAAKARQTFKSGNTTVTIEATLSDANTRRLLEDVTASVNATPLRNHEVHFVVPTGHEGFKGGTGGFVYAGSGGRTVYVNPSLANHKKTELFTQGHENDWHMPASADLGRDSNVPTLIHELGHVHDNIHGHTRAPDQRTPSGYSIGMGFRSESTVHHSDLVQHGKLTRYARKNPAEGYAEAFMQYHVAGHGSHPAADEYAQRYGWTRTAGIAPKGASRAGIAARDARMAKEAEKRADRLRVSQGQMTRGDFGQKWGLA